MPVFSLAEAKKQLPRGAQVIFLGWLCAGSVKGYRTAARRYRVAAVGGVCLGTTGSQTDTARKATGLSAEIPLYTMQGGMDYARLRGVNRFMIKMLVKMLEDKQRTPDEEGMLALIRADGDYVREENLSDLLAWYATR